nr:hypothetical protein B0A51_06177 [Rachicladosporium sp. CCFEE 5018]
MSSSALSRAANAKASNGKRRASPSRGTGPAPKRTALGLDVPSTAEEEDEESDEVEFVVGAPLEQYPELDDELEAEIFPYSAAQEDMSEGERRALRKEARVIVRAACEKLIAKARGPKVMYAQYQRYLAAQEVEAFTQSMHDSITDPVNLLMGSRDWSVAKFQELGTTRIDTAISGSYLGSCGPNVYVGSSGDMSIRLGQHVDQVLANRQKKDNAEVKLWYKNCCDVQTDISKADMRAPPRFTYLAVNQRPGEPEFQEALESVLISVLGVFTGGRVRQFTKQVNLTKHIRPSDLPNLLVKDWTPCNASLPVCMAYHGPPTPFSAAPASMVQPGIAVTPRPSSTPRAAAPAVATPTAESDAESDTAPAAKPKRKRKPVEKREIVSEPSATQIEALFADRVFKNKKAYNDALALKREMMKAAIATQPMTHCELCDCYVTARVWKEKHQGGERHINALADPAEREKAHARATEKCKDCKAIIRKTGRSRHRYTQRHQWSLPEDKRDPNRWVFCAVCCLYQWFKQPTPGQQGTAHEGSAGHIAALKVHNLDVPDRVKKQMVYCKPCGNSFHRDMMRGHLDSAAHQAKLLKFEEGTPDDDEDDSVEVAEPTPSTKINGQARLNRLTEIPSNVASQPMPAGSTTIMDSDWMGKRMVSGSKHQGLGKDNRRHTKGGK